MTADVAVGDRLWDNVADRIVEVIAVRRSRVTLRVEECQHWQTSVGHEFQLSRAALENRYTREELR